MHGPTGIFWANLTAFSPQSNAAVVPFLAGWLREKGYDGVYFDEYFKSWTHEFPFPVDTDGDGKPDTLAESQAQYDKYRPAFSAALRKALGPAARAARGGYTPLAFSYVKWFCMALLYGRAGRLICKNGGFWPGQAIMIANTEPGQIDPSLNGFTIEACNNATECIASFRAQAAVAHKPLLSVMWLKGSDPAECANAREMREKLPFLLEGTDFYDGTHVVCNDTARYRS
jgi:hypothetical protein